MKLQNIKKIKMSNKLETLRSEIASLVSENANEQYKDKPFQPGETVIPPSGKLLGESELQNMVSASLDGWLTTGRFNAEFEIKLASFLGVKHAITVNSGSSANLIAFSTLTSPKLGVRAIKKGDEVIAVAAGFPTTVNPIIHNIPHL
jgi:CDP-6-deoxy-D-xylo-4-hexulose-3-dehydrase